ncbi:Lrp/AsnC family transcriptional regulator [Acinetobacter terrestris]|jgi:DNA-binding Lrp family transcriptional regulator|uniref:Lrp/AsnC family transcriptional regulator n=1 Tax=Acinetobacter terrestris TaxID=2529843 RepID=A0AAW6URS4_9GAMM|nr:Lrp/AsnC family transcriptional regulator [Acinetobacter terrestris]MDK1683956.1 Lrp/AsnC family transcriptional regulator [Acinetobacter terrestris]NNH24966.1 Lrp/AsnC family transcriptional regulator [Acinetobacter terrestris]NNH36341.1 Lrp/AsnC family transcriptional regulator [Acinetobacter terrestris]TCB44270.1 Lrp/AsnC family transcriptional regulator [Acinetobacter terrestris]TCB57060.1 Lrp/AsnC family transcriptional regulator [Acinetobacter terrestris]
MKLSSKSISVKLDRTDKNIIRALQHNGRMQNNDLAREIGLSPSSCLRRVKLLEEAGVIQNYTTVVDPQKIGLQLLLFSRIWLVGQDAETIDCFIEAMKELPQVMECYIILGECDAMLKVVVPDLESYRKFQSTHLTKKNGITSVKTDLPSQIIKQSFQLPLDDL